MPAITCGWCQAYTNVELVSSIALVKRDPTHDLYGLTAAFLCLSCRNLNTAQWLSNEMISDERLVDWEDLSENNRVFWHPRPGSKKEFKDVPKTISYAASEAWTCHTNDCYRAAVIMARSVVEAAAKMQGHAKGTLAQKIEEMSEAGLIRPALAEQINEIRYMGNESAHGDLDSEITSDDASEVLGLMNELLNELWQAPARARRLRERRLAKNN
ncbi:DUF4145 domain-containing protein [Actinomyces vulturis]|uniref:DUF4145 domain-containing protein n=1 Tax=Actinomyces vulturis TaxID=1857645 RepID=UPI0009F4A42A|nr:DUF4145 domain-containing protein [Actinomyces vulturis]